MHKLVYKLTIPALLSICFIIFTAIIAQSDYSLTPFGRFCFLFNAIPSDIGFLRADNWIFYIYYLLLFILLTLVFWWIGHLIRLFFDKIYINRLK